MATLAKLSWNTPLSDRSLVWVFEELGQEVYPNASDNNCLVIDPEAIERTMKILGRYGIRSVTVIEY